MIVMLMSLIAVILVLVIPVYVISCMAPNSL